MADSSNFYFTDNNKIFAEHLNDTILLANAFDLTIPIKIPSMFSNGNFINTTEPRKCGMGIVTLKSSLPSGISINSDGALTGSGTVSFKFYPNFTSFGCIKKLNWDNTGSITVRLKKSNNTTIINNVTKNADISQNAELSKLQEIVIEVVFSNATLTNLEIYLKNKDSTRYGANIGIRNVNNLNDALTTIENKNNRQDERLNQIDNVNIQQTTRLDNLNLDLRYNYSLTASNYNPNIDEDIDLTVTVTDVTGSPMPNKNITLYHNGNAISTKATNNDGVAVWTYNCNAWDMQYFSVNDVTCQIFVTGWRKIYGNDNLLYWFFRNKTHGRLIFDGWNTGIKIKRNEWKQFGTMAYIESFAPSHDVVVLASDEYDRMRCFVKIQQTGNVYYSGFGGDINNYDITEYYAEWDDTTPYATDTEWDDSPSELYLDVSWAIKDSQV